MDKTKDAVKRMLKEQWEKACNAYLAELARMWKWDCNSYGYWGGDEVGGMYHYGESYNICMDDIIYCVENDVTSDEYLTHTDYWLRCQEHNLRPLSLKAWHDGAPRIPQDVFERLDALKRDFEEETERVTKMY